MRRWKVRKGLLALVITCGPKFAHVAVKGFVIIRHHLETVSIIHEVISIPLEWEKNK